MLTLQELEAIIASDARFSQYIDERDEAVNGVTLDLIHEIWEIDGGHITDQECLALIQDIIATRDHYVNTRGI